MAERSDDSGFYVRCVDCGATVHVSTEVYPWIGLCNGFLNARGEAPLGDDEIARCIDCQRKWRDGFDSQVYLAELRATISDLRKGMAVPQEQMKRVLSGPFGSNMRDWLEANKMSSHRQEDGPRRRTPKTSSSSKWKGRPGTTEEKD